MLRRRNDAFIDGILIRIELCLFTVHQRNMGPECFAAFTTPIPHVEGNDLTRCGVHRDPHPWLVGFLLHEAPHLIGFCFPAGHHHSGWPGWELDMEVLGTGREALDHTMQEPRQTDTYRMADTTQ